MKTVERSEIEKFFTCTPARLLQMIRREPSVDILCAVRDRAREFGMSNFQAIVQTEINHREKAQP